MTFLPATQDLTLYQGDDYNLTFRVRTRNSDGTLGPYMDLTGYTATSQIRSTETASAALATFTATVDDQGTNLGQVTLSLPAATTTALPATGGVWDVQLVDVEGKVQTYIKGKVNVILQVTR